VVYVGASGGGNLYAFSAAGTTGCSGTPKTCKPLWTGTTGAIELSSPAVAGGVVYIAATDGKLYAFSAAGTTGCSGTPKICKPLWTAAIAGAGTVGQSSPAVAGGVVYVSAATTLYAFSATGTTGCSGTPKVCTPLWTATGAGGVWSPAVAGGAVYVGVGAGRLDAFSAAGTTGCSGTPPSRTCTPLWTAVTGGNGFTTPTVANGVVYFGSGDTKLYAFSAAAGSTHCSGIPKTCTPLWTAATGNSISSAPAVAAGAVYVSSGDGTLYAFSATGTTGCSGTPKVCTPLWTAAGAGGPSSPAVANGVVYDGAAGKVYAFSAAGTTGCSGTPPSRTCTPLWTAATAGNTTYASPAVANGMVYEGEWDAPFLLAFSR
jgi:outer membrane protein assembly factor BamB